MPHIPYSGHWLILHMHTYSGLRGASLRPICAIELRSNGAGDKIPPSILSLAFAARSRRPPGHISCPIRTRGGSVCQVQSLRASPMRLQVDLPGCLFDFSQSVMQLLWAQAFGCSSNGLPVQGVLLIGQSSTCHCSFRAYHCSPCQAPLFKPARTSTNPDQVELRTGNGIIAVSVATASSILHLASPE